MIGLTRFPFPSVHRDARGTMAMLAGVDPAWRFVETSFSRMHDGVLKGIHGDKRGNNFKLLTCVQGELYHVAVDPRTRAWEETILTPNGPSVLLAPGMGSAVVAFEASTLLYQQTERYEGPDKQFTLRWDDPALGILWPVSYPILSDRDRDAPLLEVHG
jgi:dTDP-4-dehydrorhamnose 3,5-epimerase